MIRRLKLLFASMLVLFTPAIFALGLGELDLQSALNQQFNAEIKLTNLRGLQIDEVIPNLASQADFDRVGVERNFILTNLRFKVVQTNGSDLVIQVSSIKPIVEPFLNFIVEVLWPNGRILREYTVLLDPPIFGDAGVEAIVSTETETRSAPSAQETKLSDNSSSFTSTDSGSANRTQVSPQIVEPSPEQASSSLVNQEGLVDADKYGVTGAGDTLWAIALKVRPSRSISVQQTMLALQRANPEAFINNNINLLKAGHVLRIPDAREIREGSITSAVREVRIQNAEFDAYKTGSLAQLDATRRQTNAQSATSGGDGGELKLLASNQSSGNRAGEGNNARTQALENNLAVAEEDLDRTRRANTEMNVRLDDLQGQLETLNEILTLKDDQLAALRAEIQKMQATTPSTTPAATTTNDASGLMATIVAVLGGVVVFLIAVAGLIYMRRRQQVKALDDDFEEDLLTENNVDDEEGDLDPETKEDLIEEEEEEEEVTQETNDVIGEVEIYIAYGRFPQAITFLQNAIEAEPQRSDIQLKLLEVYVQTEDSTAFNLQFEQLRMLGDEEATVAALALQVKIPGAAEDAAVSMDATIISSEPIIAIDQPEDDDDDFSFDLDDLDSETEDDELNLTDELDIDDVELDLDLDDEIILDLEGDDEITLDLDDDDGISLDLDDDDEITLDLEGEDEITLDLDDDDDGISLDL
ncbi:MAG: FimV family protein, partial [Pseudomonadales bacterium]|nr:FimV family protein [Pseudomonadales bacterium]